MSIQIDVWGGDLHQSLVRERVAESWTEAAAIIETEVEAGMLCNVMHSDYKCPESRVDEMNAAMAQLAAEGGAA